MSVKDSKFHSNTDVTFQWISASVPKPWDVGSHGGTAFWKPCSFPNRSLIVSLAKPLLLPISKLYRKDSKDFLITLLILALLVEWVRYSSSFFEASLYPSSTRERNPQRKTFQEPHCRNHIAALKEPLKDPLKRPL